MSDEPVYQMLWDCRYCGTKKLLGLTHRYCPSCGAGQDDDARYFPGDHEKVAVEDHVYVGADKICPACDHPSAATVEFCPQCSAPLSAAAEAKRQEDQIRAAGEYEFKSRSELARAAARPRKIPTRLKVVLGLLAALVVFLLIFFFWTKDVAVVLEGHSWSRSIAIQDYQPRSKSAWCSSMPGDAYSVSRSREIRSYRQVPDGQECSTVNVDRGDGTYTTRQECRTKYRREPVYDDKCYFTVDRWEFGRAVPAGGLDKRPFWPEYSLRCSAQRYGCEREGGRSQTYEVLLRSSDEEQNQYRCSMPQNRWQATTLRSRWKLTVRQIGGGADCDSLTPLEG